MKLAERDEAPAMGPVTCPRCARVTGWSCMAGPQVCSACVLLLPDADATFGGPAWEDRMAKWDDEGGFRSVPGVAP